MTKRGKGEGTIYKRPDGLWYAQITLPGGKRPGWYGKTRKEALAKLAEAQKAIERGLPLPSEKQTVALYLASWLEMLSDVRPSTKNRYAQDVRRIVAKFGYVPLSQLSSQQVELWYADLLKTLSPTTVHHTHATLHHALYDAQRHRLIPENIADLVNAPSPHHHEMQALDEEEARQLVALVQSHRFEALYTLAVTTGMRRGELLALKWQDVDLERGTLSVRTSVQIVDRGTQRLVIAETKTANSRRLIQIPAPALEVLRSHRTRQKAEKLRQGGNWQEQGLVFPGYRGGILNPKTPGEALTKLLKKAGLPAIRFHDLRHTAISIALSRGIPVHVVAKMAGDTEATIMRTYAHVTPKMREDAAAIIGAVFGC
jgi:integrase